MLQTTGCHAHPRDGQPPAAARPGKVAALATSIRCSVWEWRTNCHKIFETSRRRPSPRAGSRPAATASAAPLAQVPAAKGRWSARRPAIRIVATLTVEILRDRGADRPQTFSNPYDWRGDPLLKCGFNGFASGAGFNDPINSEDCAADRNGIPVALHSRERGWQCLD